MVKHHPDPLDHSPDSPDRRGGPRKLRRHPVNLLALMSGLVFLTIGGSAIIHRAVGEIDAVIATGLTLIAVGAISAATLITRRSRQPAPPPAPAPE